MTSISKNVCISKLGDIVNECNNTYDRKIKKKSVDVKGDTYMTLVKTLIIKILIFKLVIMLEY